MIPHTAEKTDVAAPAAARSFWTLQGSADLWLIFEYVDASFAASLLPSYLELAVPPATTPSGKHLMMHSFGTHKVRLCGLPRLSITYRETIIGVCWVKLVEPAPYTGPYSVMTAASVDRLLPVFLGRLLGYPKRWRRTSATDRSFSLATFLSGRHFMCGQFAPTARASKGANSPLLEVAEPILGHPVVSRAPWGPLLSSGFEMEKSDWLFSPGHALARVTGRELPGLSEGLHAWDSIDLTTVGAFRTQHRWFLNWPGRAGRPPGR